MSQARNDSSTPIAAELAARWSPRAFDPDQAVTPAQQQRLLEAARWAPSCFNDQPWRYVVWDRFADAAAHNAALGCLVDANRAWAQRAPLLIAAFADTLFQANDSPNRWGAHDTGAASLSLALQATALGLQAHQMGGFDADAIAKLCAAPERFRAQSMIAVGYVGDTTPLSDKQRAAEAAARTRRPLSQMAFVGTWGTPWR